MAERASGRTDPFADVISLFAGPIAAVVRSFDQLRRGAEELRRGLENFNSTMSNLNETAERVNRLLNDLEQPVRAMMPQITRTIEAAEAMSNRISGPIDQIIPGITRLAETLNAPVLRTFPTGTTSTRCRVMKGSTRCLSVSPENAQVRSWSSGMSTARYSRM